MLNRRHTRTYNAVFSHPVRAGIIWADIEALFWALGGSVTEAEGSRILVTLNGIEKVFHRPHPRKETDKGAVRAVAKFLEEADTNPEAEGNEPPERED